MFSVVWLIAALLPLLSAGGSALAAVEPPYRFLTEWAKLSAVDGRQLSPPLDKNTSMAVLWLLPSQGYHTYAHEAGDGRHSPHRDGACRRRTAFRGQGADSLHCGHGSFAAGRRQKPSALQRRAGVSRVPGKRTARRHAGHFPARLFRSALPAPCTRAFFLPHRAAGTGQRGAAVVV